MEKLLGLCLLALICTPLAHAEKIYKTVDAKGNVVFSDIPDDNAQELEIEPVSIIKMEQPKSSRQPAMLKPKPEHAFRYESVSIVSPKNDETLTNTVGQAMIVATSAPALRPGDKFVLSVNGEKKAAQSGAVFNLYGLTRGSHTAVVKIINRTQETIATSAPASFFIKQHSKQHK